MNTAIRVPNAMADELRGVIRHRTPRHAQVVVSFGRLAVLYMWPDRPQPGME